MLPRRDGTTYERHMHSPARLETMSTSPRSRMAYAAAHVVADPLHVSSASDDSCIDWEATLAVRRSLWSLGLGVADAMDTAQRGMGLTWPATRTLIRETLTEATAAGADVVVGVGTDQFGERELVDVASVIEAYREQLAHVETYGGRGVLMASRHLAALASGADDYVKVYSTLLRETERPVILHWLGEAFDPALHGYWGSPDFDKAAQVLLAIIDEQPAKVAGVKLSVLDAGLEKWLRSRLPDGVRMFTGDDYNYVDLIVGDGESHSDALLGAFAVVAPFASAALAALDRGDDAGFCKILEPTLPLSRRVFEHPTQYYKVGVVWLAYLCGIQDHFRMVGGLESARSTIHLVQLFELADDLGLFPDPEVALARMQGFLHVHGIA